MSLVQHVSSIDGVDREHVPSSQEPAGSIRRQLSYDAFPRKTNPKDDQVGIPAYKVSVAKRVGNNVSGDQRDRCFLLMLSRSPGYGYHFGLLVRCRNRFWLRCSEAGSDF